MSGNDKRSERILGYDVARAIAILGMVLHHFALVMAGNVNEPAWLAGLMRGCDGRPATLFVILAGIGISLRSRSAVESESQARLSSERRTLLRRGITLLIVGYLNLILWAGDILRVYGISLLLAPWLIDAPSRRLLVASLFFGVGFVILSVCVNYETHWDWSTMIYHGLWTPSGSFRNLFYDGFRSVFPWSGYLFFGMWLGRLDLTDPAVNRRCLTIGLLLAVFTEIGSAVVVQWLTRVNPFQMVPAEIPFLFGTESMPPFPFFLIASGGLATAVIAACVRLADRRPNGIVVKSLASTGQLALTWYVAHIYLGLGTIVAVGAIENQTLGFAIAAGTSFFLIAVILSVLWKRFFRIGPLEWALRRMAG